MFKINNEKELLGLLKIFAEESVKKAKKTLHENTDRAQEAYLKNLKREEGIYDVSLSEQEEAEEPPADEENAEEEEPPAEEEEPKEVTPEELGVSFDSVLKDINTLRAGRSTKDKEIKDELLEYYDRLDEDERQILHLFLRELSRILQGALDGADAIDPSDSPYNFDIERSGGDESADAESEKEPAASDTGEDSSPPIKVNERQDLHEIRNKVKNLMKRF